MINSLLAKAFTFFAQILVKLQPIWDKYKALIGLIAGILIGWFVLGWGLFPIEWENATPGHLREDYQSAYLAYTAEEFSQTGDISLLRSRLGLDLPKSQFVPWLAEEGLLQEDVETALEKAGDYRLDQYRQPLANLNQVVSQQSDVLFAEAEPEEAPAEQPAFAQVLRVVGIIVVILLIGAAAFAVWTLLANRSRAERSTAETPSPEYEPATTADYPATGTTEAPVKSFSTPYVLGDDYFDPSFSIEIGNDFLGECGIGISETLGAGDPKKVTAFEAWLFDKSDIRTVTTVLASEYAFNDPDLRTKLEPKGDIVQLKPNQEITLETTSLRVKASIKELEYAQGSGLPDQSFIQKVSFELQAWVKQVDESTFPDYEDFDLEDIGT